MAEYYAVLSRAVAGLEANTPEARRAVYDKARNALIGQLKAIVPPLPTSEISRQRLELEEAIRRAEREAANAAGAAPQRAAPRRPSPPPPPQAPPQAPPHAQVIEDYPEPPPPPPPPAAAANSPQEVFRRAIREAESRADIAPPPIERAPVREEAYGDIGADFHVNDRPRRAPPPEERAPYVPPDYRASRRPEPEPRLAPDYPWEGEALQREPAIPRHAPTPQLDGDDRTARIRDGRRRGGRGRDPDRDGAIGEDFEERGGGRPSRLPAILLVVLIVGLIGGLAALAWSQRGELSRIFAETTSSGDSEQVAATPPPPPAAAPALADDTAPAAAGKNDDRMPGSNAIATTPGVRVVGETGDATAGAEDAGAAAIAAPDAQPQLPAAPESGAALVAQKAVLYEEPLDSAKAAAGVTQINAVVTWDFVDDPANGPSVVANLDVPDRGLKVTLTIHKNADNSLPASHLIEVTADATAAFPGKSIASIPRLVLKPSEDARGEPLVGATAKVADGFFWIALSALPADVESNIALLRDRGWVDLPLVYETGQRAILTFEKGTPGDRALAQAIGAWSG